MRPLLPSSLTWYVEQATRTCYPRGDRRPFSRVPYCNSACGGTGEEPAGCEGLITNVRYSASGDFMVSARIFEWSQKAQNCPHLYPRYGLIRKISGKPKEKPRCALASCIDTWIVRTRQSPPAPRRTGTVYHLHHGLSPPTTRALHLLISRALLRSTGTTT